MGSMDQVTSLSGTKHDVSGYGFVGTLVPVGAGLDNVWAPFDRGLDGLWLSDFGVYFKLLRWHTPCFESQIWDKTSEMCTVGFIWVHQHLHMVNSPECWFHRWRTQCWKHRVQVDALRLRRETQDLWGSLVSICSNSEMDKTRTNGYVKRFPWIFPLMDGKCKNPWKANCRGFVVEDLQSSQHPRQAAGMKAGTLGNPRGFGKC